jgi:RNA polymerase sigma-70 factor (ECF subfamily)
MQESHLIQAARRGDVSAFNELVLSYQDAVFTLAFRILGQPDAAADAAQEAFIAAFQKLHQFRGEHFRPWLMRIVTNACYDELRRQRRRPVSSLDDLHETQSADGSALHSQPENPELHAQQVELHAAIQRCLDALPHDQRVVAVLSDVEEYAYQEIAAITGWPVGTVKSRLSRARGRLRDCLRAVRELLPAEYRLKDDTSPPG